MIKEDGSLSSRLQSGRGRAETCASPFSTPGERKRRRDVCVCRRCPPQCSSALLCGCGYMREHKERSNRHGRCRGLRHKRACLTGRGTLEQGSKNSPWPIIQIYFFDPAPPKNEECADVGMHRFPAARSAYHSTWLQQAVSTCRRACRRTRPSLPAALAARPYRLRQCLSCCSG